MTFLFISYVSLHLYVSVVQRSIKDSVASPHFQIAIASPSSELVNTTQVMVSSVADIFSLIPEDDGEDNDVLGLCEELLKDAVRSEQSAVKSELKEPGAIKETMFQHQKTIDEAMPHWPRAFKNLAIGALVIHKKRLATEKGVHEHVELLHAICGGTSIVAHGGSTYTVKDGAWKKHRGVASEGLLFSLRDNLLALEGLCIMLAEMKTEANNDVALLKDIHPILVRVALAEGSVTGSLNKIKDAARFKKLVDDDARVHKFEFLATHVQKWSTIMQTELMGKSIYEHYGAWCSVPRLAQTGVCFRDCCIRFTATGIECIEKSPDNRIYMHVDSPLLDPVLEAHVNRLFQIHMSTYWKNKAAFKCELSAFILALMGKNVDRGFYHLGRGGAGQSLTTACFHAMLADLHTYLDMNIYFTDDEFRKQGELLVDIPVSTGQETVQGAASSLRFDLMKKHLSADPIAMRLLYSIITRMESLIGWKRFECNVLPTFSGITEENFNSLMRRAWVMIMRGSIVEKHVYDTIVNPAFKGIFLKDPTAKDTQAIGHNVSATVCVFVSVS